MNLFVVGWHVDPELEAAVWTALRATAADYPALDPATFTWRCNRGLLFGALHSNPDVVTPRRYVAWSGARVTAFDGLPIACGTGIPAHDADALQAAWPPASLEGQFVAVDVDFSTPRAEVMQDWLGMHPVFQARAGGAALLSTSAGLLRRALGSPEPDLVGAAQMLARGWVGGSRTLFRGVHALTPGEPWPPVGATGAAAALSPSAREIGGRASQPDFELLVNRTAQGLARVVGALAPWRDVLHCPITAGKDSRVLAAVVLGSGLPANYYTSGLLDSADVVCGRLVAERLGLRHAVLEFDRHDWAPARFARLCRRLIRQNDGMVNLWQIGDVMLAGPAYPRRQVSVWGMGGDGARGAYYLNDSTLIDRDYAALAAHLEQQVCDHGGLLTAECLDLARREVRAFVDACRGDIPASNVLDLHFMFERVRRWGGAQARKVHEFADMVAPFCSREFVEAMFAMSPRDRYLERLHFELLERLNPRLRRLPGFERPWRAQRFLALPRGRWTDRFRATRIGRKWREVWSGGRPAAEGLNQRSAVEIVLGNARDRCLDASRSELWRLVDRTAFERLTAPALAAAERRHRTAGLLNAVTTFMAVAETFEDEPAVTEPSLTL